MPINAQVELFWPAYNRKNHWRRTFGTAGKKKPARGIPGQYDILLLTCKDDWKGIRELAKIVRQRMPFAFARIYV